MATRPRRLLLLLDWDGTLTLTSTIPLISSIRTSPSPHPSLPSLSSSYTTDLAAHSTSYQPQPSSRTTVAAELAYLASLEPVERRSIERLEEAGLWKGVTRERVEEVAVEAVREGEVVLRKGWREMVEWVMTREERGAGVGIVSVAWSRLFIAACLREGVRKEGGGSGGDDGEGSIGKGVEEVDVRANEIIFDADGEGTGKLDRYFSPSDEIGIWTAAGKLRVMHELIEKSTRENGGVRPWTVYIGDSATDFGCLMEADVGICVRDEVQTGEQEGLREVLERVGVGCAYIGEWRERMEGRQDEGSKWLWWARDFEEVRRGILDGR